LERLSQTLSKQLLKQDIICSPEDFPTKDDMQGFYQTKVQKTPKQIQTNLIENPKEIITPNPKPKPTQPNFVFMLVALLVVALAIFLTSMR